MSCVAAQLLPETASTSLHQPLPCVQAPHLPLCWLPSANVDMRLQASLANGTPRLGLPCVTELYSAGSSTRAIHYQIMWPVRQPYTTKRKEVFSRTTQLNIWRPLEILPFKGQVYLTTSIRVFSSDKKLRQHVRRKACSQR